MQLIINGEEKPFSAALTLAALVAQLGLAPGRVAVELNSQIVAREQWPAIVLHENDRLEIVHFVGGGMVPASAFS
jgi:thiamine biosynthesis protein ThiS